MRHTVLSHLTDEELLREVEARNVLDPLVLELATRLEALLPNTQPPTAVIRRFLEERMQGKA
jgi:hypothetical protein